MKNTENFASYRSLLDGRDCTLFPQASANKWRTMGGEDGPNFSAEELLEATGKIRTGKAAGPDGVGPEIVRAVLSAVTQVALGVINGLLKARAFPREWKTAKLVLKPKGMVTSDGMRKFRPICLLESLGKLYEKLIKNRLIKELDEKGGLSDDQYGFRKGRSTSGAIKELWKMAKFANEGSWGRKDFCALTTLDVRNAFNTASWREIVEALEGKEISKYLVDLVKSYLSDRKLIVGEGRVVYVTCGVPQGSVLGPTLWNVMYDAVLRSELPVGARTIAFADDLALEIMARKEEELMHLTNEALKKIKKWMERVGLELASQKTESVLLVGRRRPGEVSFCLGGETIVPSTCIRYLGVWMRDDLPTACPENSREIRENCGDAALPYAEFKRRVQRKKKDLRDGGVLHAFVRVERMRRCAQTEE
jgi:hypothetical protein